jgi:hypothetical protein
MVYIYTNSNMKGERWKFKRNKRHGYYWNEDCYKLYNTPINHVKLKIDVPN